MKHSNMSIHDNTAWADIPATWDVQLPEWELEPIDWDLSLPEWELPEWHI